MSKTGLPSGTRDFGPEMMLKRKFITGTIEDVFRLYGFRPLETPALENLSTLTGKYGEEGDQLLFKVLNNGDFLSKAAPEALDARDSKALVSSIADRGLRYDLTVPLARFVVMNRDKLTFPFKRYQMQPVWRADRPQKGRYREFWQCDADVVGSYSVLNEVDLVKVYDESFSRLQLPVSIRINHRGIFDAFTDFVGGAANLARFMQLIDKADKIGFEGVKTELEKTEIPKGTELWSFLHEINALQSNHAKLDAMRNHPNADGETMLPAIKGLETIFGLVSTKNQLVLDLGLARGLSYYTGCIFEVVTHGLSADISIGSIGGGGRYNNLTGVFGLKDVPGVGISFGLDRIYDIMEAASLFPDLSSVDVRLLICPMDDTGFATSFQLVNMLRENGVASEVYPGSVKLKKQLDYANARSIPFVAIIGENEVKTGVISVKDMASGQQDTYPMNEIINHLHLWQF